ncbi:MAG TPA: endonuclease/exonuclease/phosphatase family protein [Methylomirabilota bacterium]|nr:endonuclease/exonuclease/phosphatase family protein [Methylomirabilota bacterium]
MPNTARFFLALLACAAGLAHGAESFRVATYNLQNYLDAPRGTRPAKSDPAKSKIRESILATKADVIALQEIGGTNALLELRDNLKREGCDFPFWELVNAWDTNIHVAVLSRFPITRRVTHTNDFFLLFGKRHFVKRGFAEVDIRVNDHYTFTLFTAHLKSKLTVWDADEQELREEEATVLREILDAILSARPNANVIVAGDLNDVRDSKAVRTIINAGRKHALIDTRPAEQNGDDQPNNNPRYPPPQITWTHYFGKEDSYGRIDYILMSRGMAREWVSNETFIVRLPNWGVGSDHRPIVATFVADDR